MRNIHQKPRYISQKYSPSITRLALPLTTWLLSHNQNYSPFLSQVIKGESLRANHLIIIVRSGSIITLTIRRLLRWIEWGKMSKTTKTWLTASDVANPGVHLTHLIRKIIKITTKISMHVLKLIQDSNKKCLHSRRRRWSRRGRGSRGIDSILHSTNVSLLLLSGSGLLTRPFGLSN